MAVELITLPINERKLTRRGQQRKKELMHGAMILFSELGYEATTTRAIAEKVGVTEAVVFRYFPTKLQLFREVVETYKAHHHYSMPYEQYRDLPFEEALTALIRGYLDNSWTNRRSMRLFLLATFHDGEVLKQLGALYDFRKRRLEEMVAERVQSGELRRGVEKFAAEILCLAVTGFLVRTLRREPPSFSKARDKFISELIETVCAGLVSERIEVSVKTSA